MSKPSLLWDFDSTSKSRFHSLAAARGTNTMVKLTENFFVCFFSLPFILTIWIVTFERRSRMKKHLSAVAGKAPMIQNKGNNFGTSGQTVEITEQVFLRCAQKAAWKLAAFQPGNLTHQGVIVLPGKEMRVND